ncbi:hypothetical protein [Jidongwangia harbinensis]|uniref:hypothetical protein n=1 Tax=Jidongwangia harbinensis TaxID=2878561 RepID=UPI001CD9789E|nr:hypothetical protein [Jidongwangia harbinensis]MCA2212806.1 hypothetical protein [Jidongwangia harbinensis]
MSRRGTAVQPIRKTYKEEEVMRKSFRAAVVVAGVAVSVLATAPIAQAATPAPAACISASEERDWGRGEITACPLGNGRTQLTGWVEDLKPGGGWVTPDGYCVAWWLETGPNDGTHGVVFCPHIVPGGETRRDFDYPVTTARPVTALRLNIAAL